MLFLWLLPVFLAMIYGCERQRLHLRTVKNPAGIGRLIENTELPDGATGTVTGSLVSAAGVAAGPYIVHIEGFRGAAVTAAAGETFTLPNVPVGKRRVVVTDAGNYPTPAINLVAGRFAGSSQLMNVSAGESAAAGAIAIKPAGTIRGTVSGASPSGTIAFIPGTWFISTVDGAGNYLLAGVPEGNYRIDVERPDYVKGYSDLVTVVSATDVTVPTVTLTTVLTPAGAIALDQGAKFSAGRTVSVDISQEPAADQIMLSEDAAFAGAVYQTISETVEYTFGADGPARLYAKFLKHGIDETAPVSAEIYVDSALPTGKLAIQNGERYTHSRKVMLVISGSDPSGVSDMMVSEDENFSGAVWEKFAPSRPFTLSAGDGEKTIYLKLRSTMGNESELITDTVGYDTQQPGDPAIEAGKDGYSNTRAVALTLSASSAVAPISAVMLSEQSDLSGAVWQTYAQNMSFTVSAGEGAKTIYAKFKDGAGNESSIVNTVVIVDTTAPTDPVVANTAGRIAAATSSVQIVFTTASTDAAFKSYEVRGGQYAAWTEITEPIIFALTSADSWYTLEIHGKDRAGNVSNTTSLRIFHGDRTILAGSAAQLANVASRNATSAALTLNASYSPYFITGSGVAKSFTDYNLTIAAGSVLEVDSRMTVNLTNLTASGVSGNPASIVSAASSPAAGDWRYLNLSGSVALNYLNVSHNYYTMLTASASAPQIASSSFTAFTNMGLKDQSTGAAVFTNIAIICPAAISGYYGKVVSGTSKTFTSSVLQGCVQGLVFEGVLNVSLTGSNMLSNTTNIYIDPAASGTLNLTDDFYDYTDPGAALIDLKVANWSGAVTVHLNSYSQSVKGSVGPQ